MVRRTLKVDREYTDVKTFNFDLDRKPVAAALRKKKAAWRETLDDHINDIMDDVVGECIDLLEQNAWPVVHEWLVGTFSDHFGSSIEVWTPHGGVQVEVQIFGEAISMKVDLHELLAELFVHNANQPEEVEMARVASEKIKALLAEISATVNAVNEKLCGS